MDIDTSLGIISKDVQEYVQLAVDEAKLKTTRALSNALSQFLSSLVIICTVSLVLGLLSIALLQWVNGLLGAPWGTLLVAAFFVLVLIVLCMCRKQLFRNMFVKLFIDAFYDDENE